MILVVGDIHCKYNILETVEDMAEYYSEIIFMGDYVDDWHAIGDVS